MKPTLLYLAAPAAAAITGDLEFRGGDVEDDIYAWNGTNPCGLLVDNAYSLAANNTVFSKTEFTGSEEIAGVPVNAAICVLNGADLGISFSQISTTSTNAIFIAGNDTTAAFEDGIVNSDAGPTFLLTGEDNQALTVIDSTITQTDLVSPVISVANGGLNTDIWLVHTEVDAYSPLLGADACPDPCNSYIHLVILDSNIKGDIETLDNSTYVWVSVQG